MLWTACKRAINARPLNSRKIANWIAFYNGRRLHQALGYRAPMAVWRERMQAAKAVDMMDNADALTTCPQQQQQTEPLAA